jgi:polyisoprenoid-binding protein YceI
MTSTTTLGELTGDYVVDPTRTRIGFVARHTMASSVPGHFEEFEGHAHLVGDDPSKSTAAVTIQAKTIQTRNPRRDQALRDKFLDVANHPTITFASTAVEKVDDTAFRLTGDLTIRGTTRPVTIDLTLTVAGNDRLAFAGTVTINRRDWGVHWSAAGFLVSRQVVVEVDVAAVRQS